MAGLSVKESSLGSPKSSAVTDRSADLSGQQRIVWPCLQLPLEGGRPAGRSLTHVSPPPLQDEVAHTVTESRVLQNTRHPFLTVCLVEHLGPLDSVGHGGAL